uniref:hypothetical protein n=1 Tax=Thaumasiovibrio occultus TaxID=1891184 RepID=UPI000B34D710|nr:hypothetical protein [Thaumasiovibrio occultus]
MLIKIKLVIIAIASLYLVGCASPLTVEESAPNVKVSNDIDAISIAVLDQRPYVLNNDKEASFEGVVRSTFGIPYSYSTVTNEPMATFLGQRLEYGIEQNGVDVMQYDTTTATVLADLMAELNSDDRPSILIELNEWKYDFHAFADSSWYDVSVTVSDASGQNTITKQFVGENDIPDSGVIFNEMMQIYKARFEEIFSDPELTNVLKN